MSRRATNLAATALGLVTLGLLLGAVLRSRMGGHCAPAQEWTAPAVVYRAVPTDADAPPVVEDEAKEADERAMSMVIATMSTDERAHLVERLTYAATRLEAQLSPLDVDFGEGDPVDELKQAMLPWTPALVAARSLARSGWRSGDLGLRWVTRCEGASLDEGERCLDVWTAEEIPTGLEARARFAAWSWATAWQLRSDGEAAAERLANALRARASSEDSTIALVVTTADLAFEPVSERSAVTDAARRVGVALAASRRESASTFEALGSPPSRRVPDAHRLELPRTDVVAVPRMAALARTSDVEREIALVLTRGTKIVRRPPR